MGAFSSILWRLLITMWTVSSGTIQVTIALIYAINMYLSIKIATIKKAVRFFSRGITATKNNTINLWLEIICSGLGSTLIAFDGEYYKYHGGGDKLQGLLIGRYESAFFVELVASYLFVKANNQFSQTIYTASTDITIWWYSRSRINIKRLESG